MDFYKWDGKELTLAKRVATSRTPSHIWIDSKSTTAYVSMQDSDELVAMDIATQSIRWRTKQAPCLPIFTAALMTSGFCGVDR